MVKLHRGTYKIWDGMKQRCNNPNDRKYKLYGAKGIVICDRWKVFANFLSDMGERPLGKSIDRIDGSKGYEPANCRWADIHEQNNNKITNKWIEHNGLRMTVAQWGRHLGLRRHIIYKRLKKGWSMEKVLHPEKFNCWISRRD